MNESTNIATISFFILLTLAVSILTIFIFFDYIRLKKLKLKAKSMDNQTLEEWVEKISRTDVGTGVFVASKEVVFDKNLKQKVFSIKTKTEKDYVPNTKIEYLNLLKIFVGYCTYLECVEMGLQEGVIAFKWIPDSIKDFHDLIEHTNACSNTLCVKRCAKYSCVCVAGECQ